MIIPVQIKEGYILRKFLFYLVPSLILILSVAIMIGGPYLKNPKGDDENVAVYIEKVMEDIKNDHWEEANDNLEKLKSAWKKILPRIQFSIERDEAIEIDVNLARLKGLIFGKDQAAALAELNETAERWKNLSE